MGPVPSTWRERCAWAIEAGRRARHGDGDAIAALARLERGAVVERRLAVLACHTSHQGDRVVRALDDPSAQVRSLAYALVPFACDEEQAVAGLARAWEVRRDTAMAEALRARNPGAAIDRHVDWLIHDRQDPRACDLLPLCTAAFVRRHLAVALDRPSAAFWKRLHRYHPQVLADVLADAVLASPGAPEADTKRRIEDAIVSLCARAPDGALRLVEALLARGILPEGIPILARHRPGGVLAALLERGRPLARDLFRSSVERLTDDERAQAIARDPNALGPAAHVLDRCGADAGPALLAAWLPVAARFPLWGGPLLRRGDLAPEVRDAVFEAWSRAAQDSEGIVRRDLLDPLPLDLQEREARRHLHRVTELGTRPAVRIAYAQHLSWDEALTELGRYAGHPDAATRGVAVGTLLAVAGRRPEEELAGRALAMVKARKFEQDPIRGVMLQALAAWPRGIWRREHLEDVGQILRDALDASDLSANTAVFGARLVLGLFRLDAGWGTRWLATWVKERGQLPDARLGAYLDDHELDAASDALGEIARTWLRQERWHPLLGLVQSLALPGPGTPATKLPKRRGGGPPLDPTRLARVPGAVEAAVEAVRSSPEGWTAAEHLLVLRETARPRYDALLPGFLAKWRSGSGWWSPVTHLAQRLHELDAPIVDVLLEHVRTESVAVANAAVDLLARKAHARFDAEIAGLLAGDESLVCLPAVHKHLHQRRQDLLDPFLGHRVIRGRFATGNTRWLLPFRDGFHRWSAGQQATFGRTLLGLLAEKDRDTPTLLEVLVRLPRLLDAPAEGLVALASDERPVIREKAIRVLGRCDAGQGVATLVRCLEDERARFAIYALRGAVLQTPADRATNLLRAASMRKVTVAKEIVRLLGEVRSDAAYAHLLELDAGDLHRDVRIALLRALWDHLGREPTWAIYERAVTGPDHVTAARVGDVPADRLTSEIDARLSALLARVLDRPEPEARIDLLRRANGLPMRDRGRRFFDAVGERLRARTVDEQRAAAAALLWRSTDRDGDGVRRALDGAMADRRAVGILLDALAGGRPREQAVIAGLARGALDAVRADPTWAPQEVKLAAALLDGPGFAAHVAAMHREGRMHSGVVEDPAWHAILGLLPAAELPAVVDALADHPDPLVRVVALRALARDAGAERGWTLPRRARLAAFQADPSPIVAGAAGRIEAPREESA